MGRRDGDGNKVESKRRESTRSDRATFEAEQVRRVPRARAAHRRVPSVWLLLECSFYPPNTTREN